VELKLASPQTVGVVGWGNLASSHNEIRRITLSFDHEWDGEIVIQLQARSKLGDGGEEKLMQYHQIKPLTASKMRIQLDEVILKYNL